MQPHTADNVDNKPTPEFAAVDDKAKKPETKPPLIVYFSHPPPKAPKIGEGTKAVHEA
ncbi:MAG: hypothetical protein FWC28_09030 [Proteobacteria bacterium]|nr:hypothetical protein [Pseudomonadota bacterium]